jgi:hypothetical protein
LKTTKIKPHKISDFTAVLLTEAMSLWTSLVLEEKDTSLLDRVTKTLRDLSLEACTITLSMLEILKTQTLTGIPMEFTVL